MYNINLTRSQVFKVSSALYQMTTKFSVYFQARCAAEALLRYLEKQRPDYFETITDQELDEIPTVLLINQPYTVLSIRPSQANRKLCHKFK